MVIFNNIKLKIICMFLLVALTGGCCLFSSPPPPPKLTPIEKAHAAEESLREAKAELKKDYPQPQWIFAAKAIEIRFKASSGLNWYDGESHATVIAVYQMTDPNAFKTFLVSRDKLTEIMEPHRFDPSVTAFDEIFLQPGEERIVHIDRAEKSRFVAVVAGYYNTDPDQSTRLFEIPVTTKAGIRDIIATPAPLYVNIFAGDNMIQQFGSN